MQTRSSSVPMGFWTIKQKYFVNIQPMVVKIRPILNFGVHPCRGVLRWISRALSLVVRYARSVTLRRDSRHLPIWELHAGSREWLAALGKYGKAGHIVEMDVNDCVLNCQQTLALPAVKFWLNFMEANRRGQLVFSLSRDSKKLDRVGKSYSIHFVEVPADALLGVIEWELTSNMSFICIDGTGQKVAMKQASGLPIGGFLSAPLVELVFLHNEFHKPRLDVLGSSPSCRYRDNFFFCSPQGVDNIGIEELEGKLSDYYTMPVKFEGAGKTRRCLELLITADAPVKCLLGFRTDPERQGESGDVTAWPSVRDPRAKTVCRGMVQGVAAKIAQYFQEGLKGLPATIRKTMKFIKATGYPSKWWLRTLLLALLRRGVPLGILPKALRNIVAGRLR